MKTIAFVNNVTPKIAEDIFNLACSKELNLIFFYYKGNKILEYINKYDWNLSKAKLKICSVSVENKKVLSPFEISSLGEFVVSCIESDRIINIE